MSGYLSGGMELSRMTVAAMDDLGYDVDYDEADEFGLDKLDPGCVKDLCGERQSLRGRLLGESDIPDDIFDHNGEDSGRLAAVAYGKESLSKAKPAFRPSTVAAMRSGKAGDTSGAEYVADQFVSVIYEDDQGEVRSVAVTKD